MSNAYTIKFNYRQALNQADRLDRLAQNLSSLSQEELAACMSELGKNWMGDNAERYLYKGNQLAGNIAETSGKVAKTASAIRTMAKNMYDAEMAALAIAKARTYHD